MKEKQTKGKRKLIKASLAKALHEYHTTKATLAQLRDKFNISIPTLRKYYKLRYGEGATPPQPPISNFKPSPPSPEKHILAQEIEEKKAQLKEKSTDEKKQKEAKEKINNDSEDSGEIDIKWIG
jgi:hypothetical protein